MVICLLYTSDAADERSSVDLGGRRIIKNKIHDMTRDTHNNNQKLINNISTQDLYTSTLYPLTHN